MSRIILTMASSNMTVLPLLVGALTTTEPELRRTGESIWHCIPLSVGKGNAAQISDSVKTVEVGSIVWTPAAPAIFFESNEVFFHEWWNGKKSGPLVVPRRVGSVFSRVSRREDRWFENSPNRKSKFDEQNHRPGNPGNPGNPKS
mgnify:CR=1 FL=1